MKFLKKSLWKVYKRYNQKFFDKNFKVNHTSSDTNCWILFLLYISSDTDCWKYKNLITATKGSVTGHCVIDI